MKNLNKFNFFFLFFCLVIFNTKVFSDDHNVNEIIKLIQKDLKTLEKAVYSDNFELKESEDQSLENIDQNSEEVLTRHLLKLSEIEKQFQDLTNKFVKVIVVNKTDPFIFDRFIDNIQNQKIYELKIAENFNEFIGANVEDENMNFEDTAEIVDSYIDAVDTDLDKNKIKVEMRQLMTEAQALEIA